MFLTTTPEGKIYKELRQIMLEVPEVLDNARLTADGQHLYLIKNKLTNLR